MIKKLLFFFGFMFCFNSFEIYPIDNNFSEPLSREEAVFWGGVAIVLGIYCFKDLIPWPHTAPTYEYEEAKERFDTIPVAASAIKQMKLIQHCMDNYKSYVDVGAKFSQIMALYGASQLDQKTLSRALAGETNSRFGSVELNDLKKIEDLAKMLKEASDHFLKKGQRTVIFIENCQKSIIEFLVPVLEQKPIIEIFVPGLQNVLNTESTMVIIGISNKFDCTFIPNLFENYIFVENLDFEARIKILEEIIKTVKNSLSEDDLKKIAKVTDDYDRERLAVLVNKSAIIAARKGLNSVTIKEVFDADDEIKHGKKNESITLNERDRLVTAYHESGHALMLLLAPEMNRELHQITICPKDSSLGSTSSLLRHEKSDCSKADMLHLVMFFLGGRAAEELVFGLIGTGVSYDFYQATEMVRSMICYFGMTDEFGMVIYKEDRNSKEINQLIKKIIDEMYAKVMNLLKANRDKLDLLANTLLAKETMYAEEVYELLQITPPGDVALAQPRIA